MALLADIVSHANEILNIDDFKDYCPNGLQVEGSKHVSKIVSGVTASQAFINEAISKKADMLLVHHGFFWRGEKSVITGLKKQRIAALLNNNISLVAYHLPLDAHAQLGNNAQLVKKLGLRIVGQFGAGKSPVGVLAQSDSILNRTILSEKLHNLLLREPVVLSDEKDKVYRTVAICTGAAQSYFELAIDAGADAFITGEVSEQSYHLALEAGVDFYSAGHHATERYGVQALGDYLSNQFNIAHEFLDFSNPI